MTRLSGTRPCETQSCDGLAMGNTRWCGKCRDEMAGSCKTPGCGKVLPPGRPSFCHSCEVTRRQGGMTDEEIAEWRAALAGWDDLVRKRAAVGYGWWWR